jgi:hypothetical protein
MSLIQIELYKTAKKEERSDQDERKFMNHQGHEYSNNQRVNQLNKTLRGLGKCKSPLKLWLLSLSHSACLF